MQELNASKISINLQGQQRETIDNGGVRNERITIGKPNVTNEANCFSFLYETALPYFGYDRIQFFLYKCVNMQEKRSNRKRRLLTEIYSLIYLIVILVIMQEKKQIR